MGKFFEAIKIGYMVIGALANFAGGQPASIFFTSKGVAYKVTLELVK